MQFVPGPAELAAAIAALLEEHVGAAVPGPLQHPVRVAAHLARLLEREARLGDTAAQHERELLAPLLGVDATGDLAAELAMRIRAGDDEDFERAAWTALVDVTRHDLAIAKPGHDAWEGW